MAAGGSRHGCPFPLQLRPRLPRDRRCPRYLARRLSERDRKDALVSEAVSSLNALESSRANGLLKFERPCHASFEKGVSATNNAVLNNVGRC
eukprot:664724-Karenia_brevis.AAC.1